MPQKSVANCFCKAVCLSGRLATSCLCGFIAISRHVFYLLKTAIIFYLVFVCRFTPRCFFLFKTTFISLAFCPFTARFFVSVQNCNYVPLTFCRFTAWCFFSKLQLYFIWYLFVVSRHGVFYLFKTTSISLAFFPFTARFFVSVQIVIIFRWHFLSFHGMFFYLFKTLYCSKQCKVQSIFLIDDEFSNQVQHSKESS